MFLRYLKVIKVDPFITNPGQLWQERTDLKIFRVQVGVKISARFKFDRLFGKGKGKDGTFISTKNCYIPIWNLKKLHQNFQCKTLNILVLT